jgi:uncharacterized repeat protein (TIGR01451 family)
MYMRQLAQRVQKQITITTGQVFFLASLLVFGLTIFGVSATAPKVSAAGECDTNAILYCGFTSNSGFIDTVKRNRDGLGHTDLQAIYAFAGLSSADYSRFVSSARQGTAYKDGRVVVDGQTVMTSTLSYGRNGYAGSPYSIGGKTYYRGTPAERWQQNSFQVRVLFDDKGTAEFVVIDVCGNPLTGTKVVSGATCNLLQKTPVSGKPNTYSFTASASAAGNAKLTKYVYNFGDGTALVTTTSATTAVNHTYAKPGTYTATLTVYASAPGGATITSTSQTCKQHIQVDAPSVSIKKYVNGSDTLAEVQLGQNYVYSIVVKNTGTNNLTNVVVTDTAPANVQFLSADAGKITDGKSYKHVIPSLAKGASVTLKINAKVTAYVDKAITNTACVNAPEVDPTNPSKNDGCDPADVKLPKPVMECTKLTGPLLDGKTMGYRFTAESKTANGAVLKRALFVFGDGQSKTVNASAGSNVITTDYVYEKEGKYSAYATLYFDVYGTEKAAAFNCYAKVEPSKPAVPECKPGIAVGDIRCNPCQYDANIPQDDPRCVAPAATLPETGAGNVIAVASLALVGGFLWYRHVIFRRHKREFMAADFGTSPLPLAEPLESPQPLANTPLAPQAQSKFSLRRRRQF